MADINAVISDRLAAAFAPVAFRVSSLHSSLPPLPAEEDDGGGDAAPRRGKSVLSDVALMDFDVARCVTSVVPLTTHKFVQLYATSAPSAPSGSVSGAAAAAEVAAESLSK